MASHTIVKTTAKVSLKPKEVYEIFCMSATLADRMEDILESYGAYQKDFLRDLTRSMKEARDGKLMKVDSLLELI